MAFGKLGEICDKYLHKGKQVYVEGKLQTRAWEDRDGIKRYTTEIVANVMQMLGSARDRNNDNIPPPSPNKGNEKSYVAQETDQSRYISDDDIPF